MAIAAGSTASQRAELPATPACSGIIHTFSIVHRGPTPSFRDKAPYVPVIIELEEGPRMPSNLVIDDPQPEKIKIGMAVEVVFEVLDDKISLPKFKLSS